MNTENQIQRILVDYYNNTPGTVLAESQYNSSEPIVEVANAHTIVVESAEVNLSNMVLDPKPDYEIIIDCFLKNGIPAGMVYGFNHYRFDGPLTTVSELMNWIYNILLKKALPYSLGVIGINADELFERRVTAEQYAESYESGNFKVYFNQGLRDIFPQFVTGESIQSQGKLWYTFRSDPTVSAEVQTRRTVSRLMKAVSIRFYSTLPTTQFKVHSVNVNEIIRENILTTIVLNSETYDVVNKHNMIYVPSQFRHITLQNGAPVTNFSISVKIYYKTGGYMMHTLAPGDYFNLNLAFIPVAMEK